MSKNNSQLDRKISDVRTYASYNFWHSIRKWRSLRGVGSQGKGVYVEANVKLQRHPEKVSFGDWVMLKEGVRICPTHSEASITIGNWTTVGHHTFIFSKNEIKIGNNCLIAPFCYLVDSDHGIDCNTLIREQAMTTKPIIIAPWWSANRSFRNLSISMAVCSLNDFGAAQRARLPSNRRATVRVHMAGIPDRKTGIPVRPVG